MADEARVTHDVTIDRRGYLIVPGSKRKSDITPFSPKVRTSDPSYQDFSIIQTEAIRTWHGGRGQLEQQNPYAFYDQSGVDSHIPGQLTLTALGKQTFKTGGLLSIGGIPAKFYLSGTSGNLFAATKGSARDVWIWDNTNTEWDAQTSGMTADPTDMVDFLGKLYVAVGESANARIKNLSAGTWSAGVSGFPANLLAVLENVMYWSDNINELYYAVADPSAAAANRLGPIYVGDTNTYIRGLIVWNNTVYIGKDDGLYTLVDNVARKTTDFSWGRDSNNFHWMKAWNGALYFPILHGLYRLIGGTTQQSVGPNRGTLAYPDGTTSFKAVPSSRVGRVVDIIPTENFLYLLIDGGSGNSQILSSPDGVAWSQVGEVTAASSIAGFYTPQLTTTGALATPNLWYGVGSNVYRNIQPYGTDDPFESSTYQYESTGYLMTSWIDGGLPDIPKAVYEVGLLSEALTSTETVQVAYQLDDLTTWQNLVDDNGNTYAFTFSPIQFILMPEHTVAKRIRFRLTLARGSTTTLTPKVKGLIYRFMARPDAYWSWQLSLRSGRSIRNEYLDQSEPFDPGEIKLLLETARQGRTPIQFADGEMEPGITNLILNPEFRTDTNADGLCDNWNEVGNPVTSLDVTVKRVGLRSQKTVTASSGTEGVESSTLTVVSGTRYTASAYVYVSAGDTVYLELREQGVGSVLASSPLLAADRGRWVRLEATAPATSTSCRLRIVRNSADASLATTFYVSGAQFEITSDNRQSNYSLKASAFCSGDQPKCHWSGQPHASTSVRNSYAIVFVTNVGEVETQRPDPGDRKRGVGDESTIRFTLAEVTG